MANYQAKNKSTSNEALLDHAVSYIAVWWVALCIYGLITDIPTRLIWFIPITFICHFATDYFTSRLNTKLWKAGKTHNFFVSIGFDQVLHYIQLFLTFYFLV